MGQTFQLRSICGRTISQLLNEAKINVAREIDAPRDQSASSFTLPPSSYTSLFAVPEQEMQIRQPLWSIPEHERRAPQPTRGGKELPEDGQPPGLVQAEVFFNNPNNPAKPVYVKNEGMQVWTTPSMTKKIIKT